MSSRTALRLALAISTLAPAAVTAAPPWVVRTTGGLVVSDSPEASQAGAQVLRAGGNAFDATVATSLALAVARPESTGLGGGGFFLGYLAEDRRTVVFDFRETAPAAATAALYADLAARAGTGPPPTLVGGHAVGVPGQVAGLAMIQDRLATKSWAELAAPAIRLAEEGFAADAHYRSACASTVAKYDKWPELKTRYGHLYATLLNDGTAPEIGSPVRRPELAYTLRLLAEKGPDMFYAGPIAAAIARAVQDAGGVMTDDDLAAYRARERRPLRGTYAGFELVAMPPPSSGGICVLETLGILEALARQRDLPPQALPAHAFVEAMKHAFADRARWLGDPGFAEVPIARLLTTEHAIECANRIRADATRPPAEYGLSAPPVDDRGTSHFCIVDREGNVVSMTETINGSFGSLIMVEPYGVLLNNEMDDFTAEPGKPNLYGLVQGEANAVAPGKRPLSSMSPTLVMRDGRPVLALGGSGGPKIITSVLNVLRGVLERDLPLDEALAAVRIHHQWLPDEVVFDQDPPEALAAELKQAGHTLRDRHGTGIVQALQILPDGTRVGASDPRKGGRPAAAK